MRLWCIAMALSFLVACGGGSGSGGRPQIASPSIELTALPTTLEIGQTLTLTWQTSDADSCEFSNAYQATVELNGSLYGQATRAGQYTFTLTCTGKGGSSSKSVTVTVIPAKPSISFSVDHTEVGAGQMVTLLWSTTNATYCSASGDWSGDKSLSGSASITVQKAGNNHYVLNCINSSTAALATVDVNGLLPVVKFSVFPRNPALGEVFSVSWTTLYADSCNASGSWSGNQATQGQTNQTQNLSGNYSYTLSCANAGGNSEQTITATVLNSKKKDYASAFQNNSQHDGNIQFSAMQLPTLNTPNWSTTLDGAVSYPIIADGRVIVTYRNAGESYGTQLIALNRDNGEKLWGPIAIAGTYGWSNATFEDGKIFVINFDGLVRAFSAANGTSLWSKQLRGHWYDAPPTAFGGYLFISGDNQVVALDQNNGAELWATSVANGQKSSPSVDANGLYVTYPCQIYGLKPVDGSRFLHLNNGCSGGGGRTSPLHNNILFARYFSPGSNDVRYIDTQSGNLLGVGNSEIIPAIAQQTAYFINNFGLDSIDTISGALNWRFTGDGQLQSTPLVVNQYVFVASTAGKLYAINRNDGVVAWSGTLGAAIEAPDEHNVAKPITGLGAGENWLIVPASNVLTGWSLTP